MTKVNFDETLKLEVYWIIIAFDQPSNKIKNFKNKFKFIILFSHSTFLNV